MDARERALAQQIRERPDDTDVRRVYADHLQQVGDPRGELIAAHLALAAPARELLAAVVATRPAWAAEWPPAYEGGFAVALVINDLTTLLAAIDEITLGHPLARLTLRYDRYALAVSLDRRRVARLERNGTAAENQGHVVGIGHDIVTVHDVATAAVLFREEWHSVNLDGEHKDGDDAEQIAFTADGRTLLVTLARAGVVARPL